jgi:hypothetical protein
MLRLTGALVALAWGAAARADCVPGAQLVGNQQDPARVAVGQEMREYAGGIPVIPLAHRPEFQDTQVYLYADDGGWGGPVVAEDWCLDTAANQVVFSRPPRMQPIFSGATVAVPPRARIWVGYYSEELRDPQCVPGVFLNYLPGGPGGTFGQEYFHYREEEAERPLELRPREGHQLYLFSAGSSGWLYGMDWCYAPATASIRFTRRPARVYCAGGIPCGEVGEDVIVWIGYVPE